MRPLGLVRLLELAYDYFLFYISIFIVDESIHMCLLGQAEEKSTLFPKSIINIRNIIKSDRFISTVNFVYSAKFR